MNAKKRTDALTRKFTVFNTFNQLLNAPGNYRPTLLISDIGSSEKLELANAYDAAQAARGDRRRVFRG
jgi:hypothetical protein